MSRRLRPSTTRRNPLLATGLVLALLALLGFALNWTALPVVIDLPL